MSDINIGSCQNAEVCILAPIFGAESIRTRNLDKWGYKQQLQAIWRQFPTRKFHVYEQSPVREVTGTPRIPPTSIK